MPRTGRQLDPSHVWAEDRASEALVRLAKPSEWPPPELRSSSMHPETTTDPAGAIALAASQLGLGAESVWVTRGELTAFLRAGPPALILVQLSPDHRGVLALFRGRRSRVRLLAPDGDAHDYPAAVIVDALTRRLQAAGDEIAALLTRAGIDQTSDRTRRSRSIARDERVARGWLVSPRRDGSGRSPKRQEIALRMAAAATGYAMARCLAVLSWYWMGMGALARGMSSALAWLSIVLLLGGFWFGAVVRSRSARFARSLGVTLKLRLLEIALQSRAGSIDRTGAGRLVADVIETHEVETMATSSALSGLFAAIDALAVLAILGCGVRGGRLVVLFGIALAAVGLLSRRYQRSHERWASARAMLTDRLIERIVGHRTRLAQGGLADWHDEEDVELEAYLMLSRRMDGARTRLATVVPYAWLVAGIAVVAPSLALPTVDRGRAALAVAGVAFGAAALEAWTRSLKDMFAAFQGSRARTALVVPERLASETYVPYAPVVHGGALVTLTDATIGRGASLALIEHCELQIREGERIWITGASGVGKSTLAATLAGILPPLAGRLAIAGTRSTEVDEETWRRRVALSAQFHNNHIFAGTLAFNLLLGRAWPPESADVTEAEHICRELGLGPLIDRMPAGLYEVVGESGWSLSHGEAARVFVARALLQHPELIILDESYAALDPVLRTEVHSCVVRRARALVILGQP